MEQWITLYLVHHYDVSMDMELILLQITKMFLCNICRRYFDTIKESWMLAANKRIHAIFTIRTAIL